MAPFRNFLGRKNQPNGAEPDGFDENHLSPKPRPGPSPISIRKSQDGEPNEYKLSGTIDSCAAGYEMEPGIACGTAC